MWVVFELVSGTPLGVTLGCFGEPFGSFLGTLGRLWANFVRLGRALGKFWVTWESFGCQFWENLSAIDGLGLKVVPGVLEVALFVVFDGLWKDLGCFSNTV